MSEAPHSIIPAGTRIRVHQLATKPEYDGSTGAVLSYNAEKVCVLRSDASAHMHQSSHLLGSNCPQFPRTRVRIDVRPHTSVHMPRHSGYMMHCGSPAATGSSFERPA